MPNLQETIYNYNPVAPLQITREEFINVGSSAFKLRLAAVGFKGGTDFEIWDSVSGGTQLVENTDYTLSAVDVRMSNDAGYDVYTRVTVTNVSYQTGSIYITAKIVLSYPDADYFNDLRDDTDAAISGSQVLQNYIAGLEISNSTDDPNTAIIVQPGQATDSTNTEYLVLPSIFYCNTGSWAKGSGASGVGNSLGKLDTGTVAINTFYYTYVIKETATNDIDVLISASQTSPTLPSGWAVYGSTGDAFLTDGSSNILGFSYSKNICTYDILIQNVSEAIPAATRQLKTVTVPPDYVGIFNASLFLNNPLYVLFTSVSQSDSTPSASLYNLTTSTSGAVNTIEFFKKVDVSSQIGYRANAASGSISMHTVGFLNSKR